MGGGLPVVLGLVFIAFFAVALLFVRSLHRSDQSRLLTAQISRYGPSQAAAPEASESAAARGAVGGMTRLLRSSSVEPGLARRLDLAGITRSPAEWAVLGGCASVAVAAVLTLLLGNILAGIALGLLIGWAVMRFTLTFKIARRRSAFSDQLPDMLQLIAGSLQAGFSLPQALDGVVREDSQPIAGEFGRALAEARIGADLEDGLARVADRMNSTDLRWTVMAIRIQREVGGNLAEVLRNTAATMRERAALRRHVKALSAEGRLSAYILIALPILIGAWLFISSPTYMRPLYTTPFGLLMLVGGAVLMVAGTFWMSRVIKVEM